MHPAVPKARVANEGKGKSKGVSGARATEAALGTPAPGTHMAAAGATEAPTGTPMAAAGAR